MPELTPISPSTGVPVVRKVRREPQKNRGQKKQQSEDELLAPKQQHDDEQSVQHIDEIV